MIGVSKVIGDMWKQESQEVRNHYTMLADKEREQHRKDNPDYKYKPRRRRQRTTSETVHIITDSEMMTGSIESQTSDKIPGQGPKSRAMPVSDHFIFSSLMPSSSITQSSINAEYYPTPSQPYISTPDADGPLTHQATRDISDFLMDYGGVDALGYNPSIFLVYRSY
jgi:hypothetical protein